MLTRKKKVALAGKRYRKTNKGKDTHTKWYISLVGHASLMRNHAKKRAQKYKVPFDLDRDWILERLQQGICEVTGIRFEREFGKRGQWTPSLDRIIPNKGYTKDNTRVVVWLYNAAKADGTDEDVLRLARALIGEK